MKSKLKEFFFNLSQIKVHGLVGPSGTGKSFRAKIIADKYFIPLIIDDGLLIYDNKIIAGKSAKKEKSYILAIRAALYDNKEHREDVKSTLKKLPYKSILVLSTSEKMLFKICERLDIPKPTIIIKIEDIASPKDIQKAIEARSQGKHIIPVPSIEIEKTYPTMLFNSINILFKSRIFHKKRQKIEKTVVKPSFNTKRGTVTISNAALSQLLGHAVNEYDDKIKILKVNIKHHNGAYLLKIHIEAPHNENINDELFELKDYIIENIEKYTGIIIKKVDIMIKEFTI